MQMATGEIKSEDELEELYGDKKPEGWTKLKAEEYEAVKKLNRKERRAALVKMRREARKK